jgi:hypothetical protein
VGVLVVAQDTPKVTGHGSRVTTAIRSHGDFDTTSRWKARIT